MEKTVVFTISEKSGAYVWIHNVSYPQYSFLTLRAELFEKMSELSYKINNTEHASVLFEID